LGVAAALPASADIQYAGVNLSGAEFGQSHLPGTFGSDYTYPTSTEIDYYQSKGPCTEKRTSSPQPSPPPVEEREKKR
jgi:hypothetical protein